MRSFLEKYSIGCTTPDCWNIAGHTYQVGTTMDIAQQVAYKVSKVLWAQQAKRKLHLRGMNGGRDESTTKQLRAENHSPKRVAMLGIIQSDSVYTPPNARVRWGVHGHLSALWEYARGLDALLHDCAQTERGPGGADMPECIRYTGNVPAQWITPTRSRQMLRDTSWGGR